MVLCFTPGIGPGIGGVHAQSTDDHGNTLSAATNLTLGSSVNGRIDPGNDPDVFRLDLSGQSGNTHVWFYTTGSLNTLGELYDSNGDRIAAYDDVTSGGQIVETNFHFPRTLAPGVYYVGVFSSDRTTTGNYTLHASRDDHGHSFDTATTLALGASAAGRIEPGIDRDVFKLDLSASSGNTHVWLYTTGLLNTFGVLYDSSGDRIAFNNDTTLGGEVIETNFHIPRTLAPGVYYVRVLSSDGTATGNYTLHAETDDHGHSLDTATTLALGASAAGRIEPGVDRDVFTLDLSSAPGGTDVWIYTTGDIDTRGWLYDKDGDLIVFNGDSRIEGRRANFHLRQRLSSGIYYISVRSWLTADGEFDTGDYTLHAQAVTDPGSSTSTATSLALDSPTGAYRVQGYGH